VLKLVRRLLQIPAPLISAEQALSVARAECERRGWNWVQPAISEGLRHWHVWADRGSKPSAFVVICQRSGEVVRSGCGPR
jgi:hypothetical protein